MSIELATLKQVPFHHLACPNLVFYDYSSSYGILHFRKFSRIPTRLQKVFYLAEKRGFLVPRRLSDTLMVGSSTFHQPLILSLLCVMLTLPSAGSSCHNHQQPHSPLDFVSQHHHSTASPKYIWRQLPFRTHPLYNHNKAFYIAAPWYASPPLPPPSSLLKLDKA